VSATGNGAPPARLHQAATSSASWRVRIALALKRIDYTSAWLDLHADDHLADAYRRIAPTQQVPCLEIDGHRLYQSVAIIEYLEQTRPSPALLPSDAAARAAVRALVEWVNSGIQPMHNIAVRRRLAAQFGAADAETNAWCRYWIERRLGALDRLLAGTARRYAYGDTLTLADIFLYPQVMTSARFGVDVAAFPRVADVAHRLAEHEPFANSHPPTR
jgi:maleylacetoacetate isomerase